MTKIDRRTFVTAAGFSALIPAISAPKRAAASSSSSSPSSSRRNLTGNGEWTYEVVSGWGTLPPGVNFGGTHGAVAQDNAGDLYVSTQSATGVLVYNPDGHLLRTIAIAYPEVHSLVHAVEGGEEYFYATVQKGTAQENWLFLK
ncbi:MAG: hypothetical protein ACRD3B_17660, partial [Candidatus Sulfotelmatobacter sp.]